MNEKDNRTNNEIEVSSEKKKSDTGIKIAAILVVLVTIIGLLFAFCHKKGDDSPETTKITETVEASESETVVLTTRAPSRVDSSDGVEELETIEENDHYNILGGHDLD